MGVPELEEYKFGFHDDVQPVFSTGEGLTEDIVREISRVKQEPEWMLEFRLKSLEAFNKMPMQNWGPDLSDIDFDAIKYYQKPSDRPARDWDDVPEKRPLNALVFQKPSGHTWLALLPNTNQKSFTTT